MSYLINNSEPKVLGPFANQDEALIRSRDIYYEDRNSSQFNEISFSEKPSIRSILEEELKLFNNHYVCPHCGEEWNSVWSCGCDDECGQCGCKDISPMTSEVIER